MYFYSKIYKLNSLNGNFNNNEFKHLLYVILI